MLRSGSPFHLLQLRRFALRAQGPAGPAGEAAHAPGSRGQRAGAVRGMIIV